MFYVVSTAAKLFNKSPQYTGGDFMILYQFVRKFASAAAGRRFLLMR